MVVQPPKCNVTLVTLGAKGTSGRSRPQAAEKTVETNWWLQRDQNEDYPLPKVGKNDKSGRLRATYGSYHVADCASVAIKANVYSFSPACISLDEHREKVRKRITPIL